MSMITNVLYDREHYFIKPYILFALAKDIKFNAATFYINVFFYINVEH